MFNQSECSVGAAGDAFVLQPIGRVSSLYKEKFGIPRQPGLVSEAGATLCLTPEFTMSSVKGLASFSHVWLIFGFHATQAQGWKQTVRPPRLGGNTRVGVFATRSTFRPNALGLSVVQLETIELVNQRVTLQLIGGDLMDGTPIFDIKPYLPYVDAIPQASAGFAGEKPGAMTVQVQFSQLAEQQCVQKSLQWQVDMRQLIEQILRQDPRPAYQQENPDTQREYGMCLYDFNLRWRYDASGIQVMSLDNVAGWTP